MVENDAIPEAIDDTLDNDDIVDIADIVKDTVPEKL